MQYTKLSLEGKEVSRGYMSRYEVEEEILMGEHYVVSYDNINFSKFGESETCKLKDLGYKLESFCEEIFTAPFEDELLFSEELSPEILEKFAGELTVKRIKRGEHVFYDSPLEDVYYHENVARFIFIPQEKMRMIWDCTEPESDISVLDIRMDEVERRKRMDVILEEVRHDPTDDEPKFCTHIPTAPINAVNISRLGDLDEDVQRLFVQGLEKIVLLFKLSRMKIRRSKLGDLPVSIARIDADGATVFSHDYCEMRVYPKSQEVKLLV